MCCFFFFPGFWHFKINIESRCKWPGHFFDTSVKILPRFPSLLYWRLCWFKTHLAEHPASSTILGQWVPYHNHAPRAFLPYYLKPAACASLDDHCCHCKRWHIHSTTTFSTPLGILQPHFMVLLSISQEPEVTQVTKCLFSGKPPTSDTFWFCSFLLEMGTRAMPALRDVDNQRFIVTDVCVTSCLLTLFPAPSLHLCLSHHFWMPIWSLHRGRRVFPRFTVSEATLSLLELFLHRIVWLSLHLELTLLPTQITVVMLKIWLKNFRPITKPFPGPTVPTSNTASSWAVFSHFEQHWLNLQ